MNTKLSKLMSIQTCLPPLEGMRQCRATGGVHSLLWLIKELTMPLPHIIGGFVNNVIQLREFEVTCPMGDPTDGLSTFFSFLSFFLQLLRSGDGSAAVVILVKWPLLTVLLG